MKIILLILLTLSSKSFAGLLIEPYGGWGIGLGKIETDPQTDINFNNWDVGARVGWVFKTFMIGVDGDYKQMIARLDQNSNKEDLGTSVTNFGAFIGVWLPMPLNLRLGYVFLSEWNLDDPYGKYKGMGASLGIGIRFFFLAINLDYKYLIYNKSENVPAIYDADLTAQDLLLSLSFPFNI